MSNDAPPQDHRQRDAAAAARSIRDIRMVRRWVTAVLAAVVVTLVVAAVTTIGATARTNASTAADETVRRIGERTADLVVAHLDSAAASVTHVETVATADVLERRDADLERILAAPLIAHPQLSGVFVGFPDGGFRFVLREGDDLIVRRIDTADGYSATDSLLGDDLSVVTTETVDIDYDPRGRPWYTAASEATGGVWTDPYVFFRSREPGVTLAKACRDADGNVVAVIGVDVSLDELSRFLGDLPIDDGADAFLLAGTTIVAAPSDHPANDVADSREFVMVDAIGLTESQLAALAGRSTSMELDNGHRAQRIELDDPTAPSWSVLIRTEKIGIVAALDQRARIAITAIAIAGLALIIATPMLTRWLRRPIEELSRQARTDSLTGVANRQTFIDEATRAVEHARRHGEDLAVAIVDIDDFKELNDRFGHRVGDAALQRLADALRSSMRPCDLVGRLGGDEFAIAMIDLDLSQAAKILDRARRSVAAAGEYGVLRVTIGAASLDGRDLGLPTLLNEADQRLLAAKKTDKDSVAIGDRV